MESEEQAYFHSIEDAFIEIRGAPLLLSPADWQIAMEWRRQEIPARFVISTLREIFAKRAERGGDRRISTLRYCRRKVEADWKETAELLGPVGTAPARSLDLKSRLGALSAALPVAWAESKQLGDRVRSIAGSSEEMERVLASLDEEMLDLATKGLSPGRSKSVAETVRKRLDGFAGRLDGPELRELKRRIEREEVRRELDLPFLSLFSRQAGD